jgi:hypothetical protein
MRFDSVPVIDVHRRTLAKLNGDGSRPAHTNAGEGTIRI